MYIKNQQYFILICNAGDVKLREYEKCDQANEENIQQVNCMPVCHELVLLFLLATTFAISRIEYSG